MYRDQNSIDVEKIDVIEELEGKVAPGGLKVHPDTIVWGD
jgi:hypothetical protein